MTHDAQATVLQRLPNELEFHRALVRNAPDHMFVLDERGTVLFANRREHPLRAESRAADGGQAVVPGALREAVASVARTGGTESIELMIDRPGAPGRWYAAVMTKADGLGDSPRVLLFLCDISERRRADEALRKTVDELDESRRQMLQAQKMESIGRLAGGVAHDFNNLLTAIISFSRFVMDDFAPGDPRRSDLVEVLKAADSAAKLTSQLLAFSRKRPVEPVAIELNGAVRRLSSVLRRTLEESIELCVVENSTPVHVMFDPGQLDQLIMNIVVNARDAMPDGGSVNVTIGRRRLERHRDLPPGEYAELSIADTGSGMTAEVLAQIFEPFFSTKGDKGTGLGLATCYGIVKQAGGHIEVRSSIGAGSTFAVLLPIANVKDAELPSGASSSRPATSLSGLAVVVEDQGAIRRTMVRTLQNVGFNVIEACTAEEAIALVQDLKARVDLLVTDVVLPGLSGIKLVDAMRGSDPDLRVLVCSGYTGEEQETGIGANQRTAFLAKPFAGDDLVSKVSSLFTSRSRSKRAE